MTNKGESISGVGTGIQMAPNLRAIVGHEIKKGAEFIEHEIKENIELAKHETGAHYVMKGATSGDADERRCDE